MKIKPKQVNSLALGISFILLSALFFLSSSVALAQSGPCPGPAPDIYECPESDWSYNPSEATEWQCSWVEGDCHNDDDYCDTFPNSSRCQEDEYATIVVDKQGTGTGYVSDSYGEIDCGTDCSETKKVSSSSAGSGMTLTASPSSGSTFGGWSGDVYGSGTTEKVADHCGTDTTCSFRFPKNQTTTIVATFDEEPAPEPEPDPGEEFSVSLTASPTAGEVGDTFDFTSSVSNVPDAFGWTYQVEYSNPSCGGPSPDNFDSSNGSFNCTYSTTGQKTGQITATASPPPGAAGSDVSDTDIATVDVGAAPEPDGSPTSPTITGDGGEPNESLPFSFRATDPDNDNILYQIDWNRDWSIDEYLPERTRTCSYVFLVGEVCWLTNNYVSSGTALSSSHSWPTTGTKRFRARTRDNSGEVSSWATHTITISEPISRYDLTVNKGGNGSGTVSSTTPNNNIFCGSTCSATYDEGTSVSLSAAPDANSEFIYWSGCDSGTRTTCNISMNNNRTVTAYFDVPPPEISNFYADPQWVRRDNDTALYWDAANASSCSITSSEEGATPAEGLNPDGQYTGPLVQNLSEITEYTLKCENENGDTTEESTTVYILPVYEEF